MVCSPGTLGLKGRNLRSKHLLRTEPSSKSGNNSGQNTEKFGRTEGKSAEGKGVSQTLFGSVLTQALDLITIVTEKSCRGSFHIRE